MSWFLFVSIRTGRVAAIVMTEGSFPLAAIFAAKIEKPLTSRFWEPVSTDFISGFLNENYEIYEYDPDSEDEEKDLLESLDADDDLAWEIPPVQEWAQGRQLDRDEVDRISHFLGYGTGFIAEEIIAGDLYREISDDQAPEPAPTTPERETPRCLWCRVPVDRRYNFQLNAPMEMGEYQSFESPVFWSDGVVTEKGDQADSELSENHYGDCVITCSACDAMFLASRFESAYPRMHRYRDYATWRTDDQLVVEGVCEKSSNENEMEQASLSWSKLAGTLRFLKKAQANELLNWSEWTALQQVVNWLACEDRKAKLQGKAFHFAHAEDVKRSILLFAERVSQIKLGTLGALSPFSELHRDQSNDENFWVHYMEVQEVLPMGNMLRIAGQWPGGWATPRHPAISEPDVIQSGWSEFDQWIALRGKATLAAWRSSQTDWVVAVDAKGNPISW